MKTIIFDFDGTLADSFELALEVAHDLTGTQRLSGQEVARLRRLPIRKVVRELGIPLRRLPRLVLQGRQRMSERMHEVHPFDGINGVVAALYEQGHHLLVMSSNSEQNVRAFLRANDMEQYFSGVYGGIGLLDKAGAIKKVVRRNKINRDICYYVGDEMRDVEAAKKANVRAVAVGWGYQDPDVLAEHEPFALVQKPAELQKLFGAA